MQRPLPPVKKWIITIPNDGTFELMDSTRLMGRYVIRELYLKELAKKAEVSIGSKLEIVDPKGIKKDLDYYAIVKIENPSTYTIYGVFERGYAGIRILAMSPPEMIEKTPSEILEIFDAPILGNTKTRNHIWVSPTFSLK
ncbi:MAG: hypothetical protein ACW976_01565 [Candidatus Ranarchaeia archaeon]